MYVSLATLSIASRMKPGSLLVNAQMVSRSGYLNSKSSSKGLCDVFWVIIGGWGTNRLHCGANLAIKRKYILQKICRFQLGTRFCEKISQDDAFQRH